MSAALTYAASLVRIPGLFAHAARLASLEMTIVFGVGLLALEDALDWRLFLVMATAYAVSASLSGARGAQRLSQGSEVAICRALAVTFSAATAGLCVAVLAEAPPLPWLAAAIVSGFVVREAGFLQVAGAAAGALNSNDRRTSVAAVAAMQPAILAIALAMSGVAGSMHESVPFAAVALGALLLAHASFAGVPGAAQPKGSTGFRDLPRRVWRLCALASAHNTISLVRGRLLVPIYIVLVARELGIGHGIFAALGVAAGAIAGLAMLASLVRRRLKGRAIAGRTAMLGGLCAVHGLVIAWGVLDLLSADADWRAAGLAVIALTLIGQTLASQVWSVGFFASLTAAADCAEVDDNGASTAAATRLWQTGKNIGAPIGFAAVAVIAEPVLRHPGVALVVMGALGLTVVGGYVISSGGWRSA